MSVVLSAIHDINEGHAGATTSPLKWRPFVWSAFDLLKHGLTGFVNYCNGLQITLFAAVLRSRGMFTILCTVLRMQGKQG